jgi:type I restriction enzyme, S subunit
MNEADTCRTYLARITGSTYLIERRHLVAYLDGLHAQVSQLRLHQAEMQKELDALMPSILDKAFKGEL